MSRHGFSLIEIVITIVVIGIVLVVGLPKSQTVITEESVRSARRAVVTQVARARSMAVQRGCLATLHLDAAGGEVWVTTCGADGSGTDTIRTVDDLQERYGVTFSSSGDSIPFNPDGLGLGAGWLALVFSKSGHADSLEISPLGQAVW